MRKSNKVLKVLVTVFILFSMVINPVLAWETESIIDSSESFPIKTRLKGQANTAYMYLRV